MARTEQELLERIADRKRHDWLGFEIPYYIDQLPWGEAAQGFAKEGVTREQWESFIETDAQISERAKDYLAFFKDKIDGERGISVGRATMHYTAWKWLLRHPDADTFPGSVNGGDGGRYQKDAYDYIKAQFDSGEWDRLTADARRDVAESEGRECVTASTGRTGRLPSAARSSSLPTPAKKQTTAFIPARGFACLLPRPTPRTHKR